MPGLLLHVGATAQCPHQGPVTIAPAQMKVTVSGQPVATAGGAITVAGCPFQVPVPGGTKPQPCMKVEWALTAMKVTVGGKAVLLGPAQGTGAGICQSAEQIPQGPPTISQLQGRVSAA